MKRLLPVLLLCLFQVSCMNEDDASDVVVLVSASSNTVTSGSKMYFTVKAWTLHDHLTELNISSFDEKNGEQQLMHQELNEKEYSFEYHYTAPVEDNLKIEMRFSATDDCGNIGLMKYFLLVEGGIPLQELKSFMMYSPFSGKEDAFSVARRTVVKSGSDDADFYVYGDNAQPESLAKEWRVNGDTRLCKANDFKYDSADKTMLTSAYSSLKKETAVTGLNAGDIILVGNGESDALCVVKIVSVSDKAGSEEDSYEFNIKVPAD